MGATIVFNQNLAGLDVPDGLVIDVETQQAGTLVSGSINEVDFVGTGTWGQRNVRNIIGTPAQIATTVGRPQVNINDLATLAQIALNKGVETVAVVRVDNGSSIAAVLPLMGGGTPMTPPVLNAPTTATTTGTLAVGTYKYVLTAINAQGETIASNEVSIATTTGTSTITNTWATVAGATGYKLYRTAVGGAAGTELLLSTGTLGVVLTFIDTGAGALGVQTPPTTNSTGTPTAFNTLTALYPGSGLNPPAGNPAGAVPATGVLKYTPGTPISMQTTSGNLQKVFVDLSLPNPLGQTEVFQNLDGNVFTAGSPGTWKIDPTVLSNAIASAINNGTPLRGPSQFWVSTVPGGVGSAGVPIIGTVNALGTQGVDGNTFANGAALDAAMLGTNAANPPTGMFALSGLCSGGVICLVGCTDVATVAGQLLTFAKANNGASVMAYPMGTPMTGAGSSLDLFAQTGIGDISFTPFGGDWPSITDANNGGITRYVDPAALAAIQFAITSVPRSPANIAFDLITGTTRVTADGNTNVEYGPGEQLALEKGGINYWTNQTAGGGGFAIAHNKNSLGKTQGTIGNIAYWRNLQFAIEAFDSPIIGKIVGGDQGFDGGDDTQRGHARALFNAVISDWQTAEIFDGDVPQVICDLTNNSPGTGMLRIDIYLQQREIIDVVAVGLMSGVGPLVSITPAAA